ncbi:Transcriptional activator protein NhaR [Symmachiella macrocystis]|uniref:Transcriptional activator protein NhaR n=1 Tax=Symmachiella macrocystis TaxID=2527985 RepID=A0A5C6BNK4_9PLAN|nr:transcriptional activator NhaR [Symmachiella macrocystis]TWU12154.1 Transcriptional activator protein NhaR [Symmachiella macrocystis]
MNADWLNYHHLLYFWMVAKEGSITRACEKLHLAQPTISGQLKKLESALGEKLYERVGRDLVLTDVGQMVYRYADEMFAIGQELGDAIKGHATGRPIMFMVGIADVLPKLIAFRLLEPALHLEEKVQIVCREGPMEQLLSQLATHELDVVFSDSPAGSMVRIRAFNHALGECGVGLFGTAQLCRQYEHGLPESLSSAPFLLPAENTAMRRSIEEWLIEANISPQIVGEFDDTALLKVFAEAGIGFVPGPLAIRAEIERQFGLSLLLEIPNAIERFYAITVERRIRHPAVMAISEAAKESLFAQ